MVKHGGCADSDLKDVNVWKNLTLRSGMKSVFSECNDAISSEVVNRLGYSNSEPSAGSHKLPTMLVISIYGLTFHIH
jgi:hypothetical protein